MNKKNLEMMKENLEKVLEEVKIELENEHFTENEKDDKDGITIDIDKLKKFLCILNNKNEDDDYGICYFIKFNKLWESDIQDLTTTLLVELKDIHSFVFNNQYFKLCVDTKKGDTLFLTKGKPEMESATNIEKRLPMNYDTLINEYITAILETEKAQEKGIFKIVNKQYDILVKLKKKLKEDNNLGLKQLKPFLKSENNYIKLYVATALLCIYPEESKKVLSELSLSGRGECSFSAKMTLKQWENGKLKS